MKIVIVGCGLIGVTTAYSLRQRGHDVTVLERAEGPAREASFANGGMLTPGMCQPWNGPGSWRILLRSLVRSDTALQLRLSVLPRLIRWGTCFLRNSTAAAFERNCRSNLRLALHSLKAMHELREQTQIEFGRVARGSLGVFRGRAAWEHASREAVQLFSDGLVARRLTVAELVEIEPALQPIAHKLSGAIHYLSDEVGDAQRFCEALTKVARKRGVDFRFRCNVRGLEMHRGRVAAVIAEKERFVADRYVIAAGAYSASLLKDAGIRLPVQPAKGYSVTFKEANAIVGLRHPMIDHDLHAVLVPFDDGSVRTAGTAEFAGFDPSLNPARVRNLLALTRELLPEAQLNEASAIPWCGLRPSSPDGVAIVGATPLDNLWVNSGHGHLGWTLAAGSARLFTSLMSGDAPGIDPNPYSLKRFS